MSNCYCELPIEGLPAEDQLLEVVSIRPITPEERERYDLLMESEHYLPNAIAVGQVLRCRSSAFPTHCGDEAPV